MRGYTKPKEHYRVCFSRFTRVFPAVWFNFSNYLQKIVMKYFKSVSRTLVEYQAAIPHYVGKLRIIWEPYVPRLECYRKDFTFLYIVRTHAHNALLRAFCFWPTAFHKTQNLTHRRRVVHACLRAGFPKLFQAGAPLAFRIDC